MFYTVKNTDGKIVARLRTSAQCAAFVARVGGDLTISDSADHTPNAGINSHNEWALTRAEINHLSNKVAQTAWTNVGRYRSFHCEI